MRVVKTLPMAGLLLVGCSTSNYQQPVQSFSEGVTSLKTVFTQLSNDRQAAYTGALTSSLVQKGTAITPPSCPDASQAGADTKSVDCSWEIIYPDHSTRPVVVSNPAASASAFISALDSYAQGLSEITKAQDVADLKDAVAKATSSIATVAALAAGPAAPAAIPIIKTVSTGAAWVFGKIADAQRVQTLQEIVEAAQPTIAAAVPALKNKADALRRDILTDQTPLINRDMGQLTMLATKNADWPARRSVANQIIQEAITYQATSASSIGPVLDKMLAAHTALLNALKNPNVSFNAAVEATTEFLTEASLLAVTSKGK